MVFPTSNLPTTSQPWGREVQKRIENIEATSVTNEVNNVARDAQLSSSYRRLDTTVTQLGVTTAAATQAAADAATAAATAQTAADNAQDAIDGLLGLGTTGSLYDINADNINGGTITGITVQTGEAGVTRAVLSGSSMQFYNGFDYAGNITGGSTGAGSSMILNSTGAGQLEVEAYGVNLFGDGGTELGVGGVGDKITLFSLANGIASQGTWNHSNGVFSASSGINVGATGINSVGPVSTDGSLTRTTLIGGGSTTCTINTSGQFVRTTSSERYKQDIQDLPVNYDELISLVPKRFRLKDEVVNDENARYYAGFIAEEIDATSLKDFVGYEKLADGTSRPDSVYYGELTAALLSAIKHQDTLIKGLTARIEALEG